MSNAPLCHACSLKTNEMPPSWTPKSTYGHSCAPEVDRNSSHGNSTYRDTRSKDLLPARPFQLTKVTSYLLKLPHWSPGHPSISSSSRRARLLVFTGDDPNPPCPIGYEEDGLRSSRMVPGGETRTP